MGYIREKWCVIVGDPATIVYLLEAVTKCLRSICGQSQHLQAPPLRDRAMWAQAQYREREGPSML
jgi:hypothetical protein